MPHLPENRINNIKPDFRRWNQDEALQGMPGPAGAAEQHPPQVRSPVWLVEGFAPSPLVVNGRRLEWVRAIPRTFFQAYQELIRGRPSPKLLNGEADLQRRHLDERWCRSRTTLLAGTACCAALEAEQEGVPEVVRRPEQGRGRNLRRRLIEVFEARPLNGLGAPGPRSPSWAALFAWARWSYARRRS